MRVYVRIPRHSSPPPPKEDLKTEEEPKVDKEGLLLPHPKDTTKNAYDVILCGTGLIQSILASALSRTGKTVLHCDGNDFYGELDGTMNLKYLMDWAKEQKEKESGDEGIEEDKSDDMITLRPLGSLSNVIVHSFTNISSIDNTNNSSEKKQQNIPTGTKVSTPYGMGTVLKNDDASQKNSTSTNSLSVSLHEWTMADGSNPIAYFGNAANEEVQPTKATIEMRQEMLAQKSRYFYLDFTPGLLYASANAVDGILSSGVGEYVEFKSILGLLLLTEDENNGGSNSVRSGRGGRRVGTTRKIPSKKSSSSSKEEGKEEENDKSPSTSALKIMRVPCSKGDVFSTKLLSPSEKRRLMKFLQLALDYAHASSSTEQQTQMEEERQESTPHETTNTESSSLQEEQVTSLNERRLNQGRSLSRPQNKSIAKADMEVLLKSIEQNMDFDEYLKKEQKLDLRLRRIVIHALSLGSVANEDKRKYNTEKGMNDLCRHLVSLGRYGGTAFLCPLYGSGELSQSFCRSSAVHGGVYLLRRPAKRILCKKGDGSSEEENVYGIILGGDTLGGMDNYGGGSGGGGGVVEDKVIHGRNVIVANDSLILPKKKSTAGTITRRRILRRISIVRGKLIPSSDDNRQKKKKDEDHKNDDEMNQEQRYIIVMTPQTGSLKNESVIHGLAIDDSVFVSPNPSRSEEEEDVYTVLHLTTTVECCVDEDKGEEVMDDSVLERAVKSLLNNRNQRNGDDEVVEELYHVSFSYPDLDGDDDQHETKQKDQEIAPKGLHVCHRPGQSITVDAAFREAERIFHNICPGAEFLVRSEEIDKAVQERVGNTRIGDDDEGMMLESAMNMIGSAENGEEDNVQN